MKYSVSSYSFEQLRNKGLTELEMIPLAKELGFDGIEFCDLHPTEGKTSLEYAASLRAQAEACDIDIVNYTIAANFIYGGNGSLSAEVDRLKAELEVAATLGVKGMRHDAAWDYKKEDRAQRGFENALPRLIEGCRLVTEHAAEMGIRTMVENHGYFCQESQRVEKLIAGVAHPNFGVLLDMGNFLCADEAPEKAFGRLAPFAFHVHAKDFHFKSGNEIAPACGFFRTRAGNYLRGAIIGHGVVPVYQCLSILKANGYDGFVTVEFEGIEDCKLGCSYGLETLKKLSSML